MIQAICINLTPESETPSFEFFSIVTREPMWWDCHDPMWTGFGPGRTGRISIENPCGENYVGPAHWMPRRSMLDVGADFGGWVDQETGGGLFADPWDDIAGAYDDPFVKDEFLHFDNPEDNFL